jgi:hypothetical protein
MIRQALPTSAKHSTSTHHLNINDVVLVALTPHGFKIAESVSAPELSSVNDLGQTRWQLWCLMQTFGPYLYNGATQVFVENRLIWTSKKEER